MNKILITGSSGYVGNYILKTMATKYPHLSLVGMSRSAKARDPAILTMKNITLVKGDCLDPLTFKPYLADIDSIIHCVGTLIPSLSDPKC